ncbi:MAG: SlyX family protein [Pseudomonadota bacterium]|nr:MAG: SlyX family protein [Pseudomonadota bacterium]
MDEQTEAKLTDLEIRITHQEASIDELTRTVLAQDAELKRLREELVHLRELLRDLAPSAVRPESEETPPPHY